MKYLLCKKGNPQRFWLSKRTRYFFWPIICNAKQKQKRGQSGCQQSLHTYLNWKCYSRSDIYTLHIILALSEPFSRVQWGQWKYIYCVLTDSFKLAILRNKENVKKNPVRQEIKNIGTFYEKWENLIKMPRNFIWFVLSTNRIKNCRNIAINSLQHCRLLWKMEKPDKIAKKFHLIRLQLIELEL